MKESKLNTVLEQLNKTARDLTKGANSVKLVIDSISDIHSEVMDRLETEEEKERYQKFVKGSNEILNKVGKSDYNELIKSLETLAKYGKQNSSNKA